MTNASLWVTADRAAIEARIKALRADSPPHWGKMNAAQMLWHSQQPLRVAIGQLRLKHSLIGKLFGKMAKKRLLAGKPWGQGMPTAPEFRIAKTPDFESERRTLLDLVRRFGEGGPASLTQAPHPFFGPMIAEEWTALQWKHLDHHLRQFGV
ncbi:MAG: DUF1569 domain-containing protein [Planctomycetota bacterium]|nr:DUF1569 domain-containing protein [Planctomycetota bacterium]